MIIAIVTTVTVDRIGEVDNPLIVVGDHNNRHHHRLNGEVARIVVAIEIVTADGVVNKCDATMTMAVVIQGELSFSTVFLFYCQHSDGIQKQCIANSVAVAVIVTDEMIDGERVALITEINAAVTIYVTNAMEQKEAKMSTRAVEVYVTFKLLF